MANQKPEPKAKPKPAEVEPTVAEQRRTDWGIVKRLMENVWPKDDWKTRGTVVLGFGLLISGKVGSSYTFVSVRVDLCPEAFKRASSPHLQGRRRLS